MCQTARDMPLFATALDKLPYCGHRYKKSYANYVHVQARDQTSKQAAGLPALLHFGT